MRLKSTLLLLIGFALLLLSCSDKEEDKNADEQTQSQELTHGRSVIDSLAAAQFDTSSSAPDEHNFSLIGTWHYSMGPQQVNVTYKPDGTFYAESMFGEQLMDFYGTYTFDGVELTSVLTKVVPIDTTDTESVKQAEDLNARIEKDPTDLSATANLEFSNSDEFVSFAKDGRSSTYTRVK